MRYEGCINLLAKSPLFVKSSKPVEFTSNLPKFIHLESDLGKFSKTVLLTRLVFLVTISPYLL